VSAQCTPSLSLSLFSGSFYICQLQIAGWQQTFGALLSVIRVYLSLIFVSEISGIVKILLRIKSKTLWTTDFKHSPSPKNRFFKTPRISVELFGSTVADYILFPQRAKTEVGRLIDSWTFLPAGSENAGRELTIWT